MQHIIRNLNYGEMTALRRLECSLQECRNFNFITLALWCVSLLGKDTERPVLVANETNLAG